MEKYTVLNQSNKISYSKKSPLMVCAKGIIKNNETGKVFARIMFKNISDKKINAIRFSVKAFNSFGEEVEGISEYAFIDFTAGKNEMFGGNNAVPFPDALTRSFSVKCTEIVYLDGSSVKLSLEEEWIEIPEQIILEEKLGKELADQYRRDTNAKAKFVPDTYEDIWRCTCGAINKNEGKFCGVCGSGFEKITSALDEETLREHLEEFKKAEAEKAEAARLEFERRKAEEARIAEEKRIEAERKAEEAKISAGIKKKKRKKITAVLISVIVVVAIAISAPFAAKAIAPLIKYGEAVKYMENGEYAAAMEIFLELGGYMDSEEKFLECHEELTEIAYQDAIKLFENGDYENAAAAFSEIGNYKDSVKYCDKANFFVKAEEAKISLVSAKKTEVKDIISELESIPGSEEEPEVLDECYYLAAENLISAGDDITAKVYLEKISAKETEKYKEVSQEIEYLGIYNKAKAITVTNKETKTQLQELCDKLPEDYPGKAELLAKIEEYDKKNSSESGSGNLGTGKFAEYMKMIQGTWVGSKLGNEYKLVVNGNRITLSCNGEIIERMGVKFSNIAITRVSRDAELKAGVWVYYDDIIWYEIKISNNGVTNWPLMFSYYVKNGYIIIKGYYLDGLDIWFERV